MSEFLAAVLAFPTIAYSVLLALAVLYWLTVIIGALDIDLFSPEVGDAGGDMATGGHHGHGFLEFLSVGRVPVTITASVFLFLGWFLCMLAELLVRAPLASVVSGPVFSLALIPASMIPAVVITGLVVRPLRHLFNLVSEHGEAGLVGRMVRISSLTVDHQFGTAVCDNAGPGILMNVFCRHGVQMKRDDMAVVVEFDASNNLYLVAPFSHVPTDVETIVTDNAGLPPVSSPAQASTPPPAVSLERRMEPPQ
ncbi:MAG: hypothetical protein H0W78_06175 [Planctomycetes bacterium]|nr:hypothetical protein [Planctomycetota bacterium]